LAEWETIRLRIHVAKWSHLTFGAHLETLERPPVVATNLHLCILLCEISTRLDEIPARNLMRGFGWNSGCRRAETLTGKHKTDHGC
jgi:hypothetical protein